MLILGLFVGAGILAVRTIWFGTDLRGTAWPESLLLVAAWMIVPLGLANVRTRVSAWGKAANKLCDCAVSVQWIAALALTISFACDAGAAAAWLAVPWLGTTLLVALSAAAHLVERRAWPARRDLPLLAAFCFLPVGAVWLLLSRYEAQPLGFSDEIVLLTSLHFHYGGFAFPLLANRNAERCNMRAAQIAAEAACAGFPLVAIGITLTQLGASPLWETAFASLLSLVGLAVAHFQFRNVRCRELSSATRMLVRISALALAAAMLLSLGYALRAVLPEISLSIRLMRATHGTLNALGFALVGLLAWRCEDCQTCTQQSPTM